MSAFVLCKFVSFKKILWIKFSCDIYVKKLTHFTIRIKKHMAKKLRKDHGDNICSILRMIRGKALVDIKFENGKRICGLPGYETRKLEPSKKMVLEIAKSLGVNPDVLLYNFGFLSESEKKIIESDPFFYMNAIKKLCENHENRYGKNKPEDLKLLNVERAILYCKDINK